MRMRTQTLCGAALALVLLMPSAAQELLGEASVERDDVRLSDLLPQDAGPRLRTAAERVVLGRAPQPGSVRVFRGPELKQAAIAFPGVQVPESVVVRRAGWPIPVASVQESLAQQQRVAGGGGFSPARILSLPDISSRTPNPGLEVTAIRKEPGGTNLLATVRCRERRECGSFLVKIYMAEAARTSAAELRESGSRAIDNRVTSNIAREAFAVRANRTAILKIEEGGLLISEPVTPLRCARRGEIVPVRSSLGQRVLRAEVIGPDLVTPADGADKAGVP